MRDQNYEILNISVEVSIGSLAYCAGLTALFLLAARPNKPTPLSDEEPRPAVIARPVDLFKEDTTFEKPAFLPPKPISHSPKISPSSIPNPNPSVTANKPESGYPNYGGYLYNIPGYSAFQPVSYPSMAQPNPAPVQTEPTNLEYLPLHSMSAKETKPEERSKDDHTKTDVNKQQDFEEHFTPEIIPAVANTDAKKQTAESKMNITSLAQGSGATVTIPQNKDMKKKPERFSLKTSIPISKIDMKCVNTPTDAVFQNAVKKPVLNPTFQKDSPEKPKVDIQSNIVIKTANKETEVKDKPPPATQNNSISTLINAAEVINKNEGHFRVPEPKPDVPSLHPLGNEVKKPPSVRNEGPQPAVIPRPMFNPINVETSKQNFPIRPPDGGYSEQKNQILFIQNKNVPSPKMMVAIPQQNPQVLLQRTNFESKNLQAPSRLSNQSKKSKEEIATDNGTSSKVVALKRLHQDNCDENDFENLITENQIYGNKIVVKEKSQGTQQEQDLKAKSKDKQTQSETKNVVLQPNFVYVSNVQLPANLMMLKNNSKICQTTDCNKIKVSPNENKTTDILTITNNNNAESHSSIKNTKSVNVINKEIHVLKSSNNVLQSLSNNSNNKTDTVLPTSQKVVMNPPIVYQVLTGTDNKSQQTEKDIPKVVPQKREQPKLETKHNEKLFITCQYQVESKLPPKIVITANLRPKIAKVEEVSTLDMYAKRRRLRRLKYLSNISKDSPKTEMRKTSDKNIKSRNIITPDNMKAEIFKEFTNTKGKVIIEADESDSDYGEDELSEYNSIIEEYGTSQKNKVEFLAALRLATHKVYKEKELEKQDRALRFDSVATAYISAGLDRLSREIPDARVPSPTSEERNHPGQLEETKVMLRKKQMFLTQLKLKLVSPQYKDAYEKTWKEVLRERRRRNGTTDAADNHPNPKEAFDPNSQLQLLTEIKNSVTENNNLIKRRLDPCDVNSADIRELAEKNFSELNRLSKMADRSVRLFSGQDTRKRDLTPGFDSENIKKAFTIDHSKEYPKVDPVKDYPKLNIPNVSKIISLKSAPDSVTVSSTPATSMDEPRNSAAGAGDVSQEISTTVERTKDFGCQTAGSFPWPGLEAFVKSYREYEMARKKEICELHRRNTTLRVESALVTRNASRDSDRARALLAERQNLAVEENRLRVSLQRLCHAVDVIRNS